MTDIVKLGMEFDSRGLRKGTQELQAFQKVADTSIRKATGLSDSLQASLNRSGASLTGFSKRAKDTAPATKKMAGGLRNLGQQLNQVAQQTAVTGNLFQSLSIQAPDILQSFGTLGIFAGVAAGSLVAFFNTVEFGDRAMRKFDETIQDTIASLKSVRIEQAQGAINRLEQQIKSGKEEIEGYREEVERLESGQFQGTRFEGLVKRRGEAAKELLGSEGEVTDLIKEQQRRKEALAVLEKDLLELQKQRKEEQQGFSVAETRSDLAGVEENLATPAERARIAFERRNKIIQDANVRLGLSAERFNELRINNAKKLQDELTAIEQKGSQERNGLLSNSQEKALGYTGQFFGNLAQIAQKGGEDQFQRYKNLASAQASISAALAIASVLGETSLPALVRIPLAASIGALAFAQVAEIQGQDYQGSRASGGQVAAGGAYLVGENGPEVLQMGGSGGNITPSYRAGGQAITQNVVLQVAANTASDVEAQVQRMIPLIKGVALSTVQQEARKGGSFSRAIGAR